MAVGTVIITGTIKMLSLSVQSSQVVRSSLSEQELRAAVNNIIADDLSCKSNLKPKGGSPSTGHLTESTANEGIGSLSTLSFYSTNSGVTTSRTLIDQSTPFKGQLDIVTMSLTRTGDDDPKGSSPVDRTFVVHYKKKGLGQLNTVGGGVCSTSDTSGCYYVSCDLRYRLENKANPEVMACSAQNCVAYASVAAGAPDCYTVEQQGKQRTLVGCGGTDHIAQAETTAFGFGAGEDTTGAGNTFIGFKAGNANTTGEKNVFIGQNAGKTNTTGNKNTFLGFEAGRDAASSLNTFLGFEAGLVTTVSKNTFIGAEAGKANTTGHYNVFIGFKAGTANTADDALTTTKTEASNNVFIGNNAGQSNTTGAGNVCIGKSAGADNTVADHNTFIGADAGAANTTGEKNTFVGSTAGYSSEEAGQNTFVGATAGYSNTTGYSNTFIGTQAGYNNTTGNSNVFLGVAAGDHNITGSRNTFLGTSANRTRAGDDNVYIGYASGYEATGSQNVFIGSWTGRDTDEKSPLSSGNENIFIGYQTGANNETGHSNTFVGKGAGINNTTGSTNVFIGRGAGRDNTTGSDNTYVGEFAAYHMTTGNGNTVLGNYAGYGTMSGNSNIYIKAGSNKIEKTSTTTHGIAQNSLQPGNNNIMIGSYSFKKAKEITSQHSNYLWIQDLIEGNSQEKWVAINNQVETKNLYASLHTSSDKRLKTNLTPLDGALEKINQLKSYSFNWKDEAVREFNPPPPNPPPHGGGGLNEAARGGGDPTPLSPQGGKGGVRGGARRHFGFIAQEALEVLPEVVEKNRKGFFTIRYTEIIPLLVSAFKEFQNKILIAVKDLKNIVNGHVRSIAKLIETDKELIKQTISLKQENKQLKTFLQKQNQEILELKKRIELLESPPPK